MHKRENWREGADSHNHGAGSSSTDRVVRSTWAAEDDARPRIKDCSGREKQLATT